MEKSSREWNIHPRGEVWVSDINEHCPYRDGIKSHERSETERRERKRILD